MPSTFHYRFRLARGCAFELHVKWLFEKWTYVWMVYKYIPAHRNMLCAHVFSFICEFASLPRASFRNSWFSNCWFGLCNMCSNCTDLILPYPSVKFEFVNCINACVMMEMMPHGEFMFLKYSDTIHYVATPFTNIVEFLLFSTNWNVYGWESTSLRSRS